ncbi:MAG: hypothetical protein ACOY30_07420 [Bacillota bacterium]
MKRIWLMALAIIAIAVIAGGGATLALYSAGTAPQNSQFTAGTLKIDGQRDQGDSIPGPMFYVNEEQGIVENGQQAFLRTGYWAPGDTFHRVLQVENTGSLDGWLKSVRASLTSGNRALADILQVRITTDPDGINNLLPSDPSDPSRPISLGQLMDATVNFNNPISVDVGDVIDLHFWVTLPSDADNAYQDMSLVAGFTVNAEQKRNNP